uniref:C2H2-type domain-containing protein n=1 Tax=Strigamia maritima TaxID=126957 RepID=T1JM03_STRMM
CGKSFWLAESADVHVCSHIKFDSSCSSASFKSVKTQTCNICSKTFRNASYFQLHMRMHAGDSTYSCNMCDKTFSCSWNLKTHLAVHKDDKPFACTLCGVGFKLKANMQRHERSHVLSKLPNAAIPSDGFVEKKIYACSTCGMRFKVKANVIRHERLHINSPNEKQKSNEVRTGDLSIELKAVKSPAETSPVYKCLSVVANRHACKVCGKTYKQRCHLLSHVLSHSDAQPYVCEMCGKSFSLAWNLKTHLAVHNQEKPFSCTICGSNFKLKTALQRHERSHLSVKMQARQILSEQLESGSRSSASFKELQCPGCEKKYLTFSELRSHMEVHNI